MRDYIQLTDSYIFDLNILREALFAACDGTTAATLKLCLDADTETTFFDDEAITGWHRLRDALARRGATDYGGART